MRSQSKLESASARQQWGDADPLNVNIQSGQIRVRFLTNLLIIPHSDLSFLLMGSSGTVAHTCHLVPQLMRRFFEGKKVHINVQK